MLLVHCAQDFESDADFLAIRCLRVRACEVMKCRSFQTAVSFRVVLKTRNGKEPTWDKVMSFDSLVVLMVVAS